MYVEGKHTFPMKLKIYLNLIVLTSMQKNFYKTIYFAKMDLYFRNKCNQNL